MKGAGLSKEQVLKLYYEEKEAKKTMAPMVKAMGKAPPPALPPTSQEDGATWAKSATSCSNTRRGRAYSGTVTNARVRASRRVHVIRRPPGVTTGVVTHRRA